MVIVLMTGVVIVGMVMLMGARVVIAARYSDSGIGRSRGDGGGDNSRKPW